MSATIVLARRERPLSSGKRAVLMAGLALLNLVFYLFCLLAVAGVGALVVVDLALTLLLAQLRDGGVVMPSLQRMVRLLRVLVGSLRLREGARDDIDVTEAEAPHLYATVRSCAMRIGCAPPDAIVLEMSHGAAVRLDGYRSGHGKTTLSLGLDLLVGLSQDEVEAVLLHEMAHARLVQRGLQWWAARGRARSVRLAQALRRLVQEERDEAERPPPYRSARLLCYVAAGLARAGSHLFAIYSRQDEFTADLTAAEVCGAESFGRALLATCSVSIKSQDVSWRDRVVRSQRAGSYTTWLRDRLLPVDAQEAVRLRREAVTRERRTPFDTHPLLMDRLAHIDSEIKVDVAQPHDGQGNGAPVAWLNDPDAAVERLFAQMERAEAQSERDNSAWLRRIERRSRRRKRTAQEWSGIGVAVVGIGCCVVGPLVGDLPTRLTLLAGGAVCLLIAAFVIRLGAPSAPEPLPIPDYAVWEAALEARWKMEQQTPVQRKTPAVLTFGPNGAATRRERREYWKERGYRALDACDYPTAAACGLECLRARPGSAEGLLLAGIAHHGVNQAEAGDRFLGQALVSFRRDPSVNWAAGWICLLRGDWLEAEAYLMAAMEGGGTLRAPHPTLLGALALAQLQRGKMRLAIFHLGRAVALAPDSLRLRLRLASALLLVGKAREALSELEALTAVPNALAERDVRIALLSAYLLLDRTVEAQEQAATVAAQHPTPGTWYRIGAAYARLKYDDEACDYLHRSTAQALYPAAWVELGNIYARRKQTDRARACFLGALNLFHPLAPDADRPLDALSSALEGLRDLREPAQPLFLWETRLNLRMLSAFPVDELHLLTLAPNRQGVISYVQELFTALHPGGPDIATVLMGVQKTDAEPPLDAVPPGIVGWRGLIVVGG